MSYIGTKGKMAMYTADGQQVFVDAEIIDTFYEPGDPIMAVSVRELATGVVHGGLDSQDFRPFPD